jgi:hypothetical protein
MMEEVHVRVEQSYLKIDRRRRSARNFHIIDAGCRKLSECASRPFRVSPLNSILPNHESQPPRVAIRLTFRVARLDKNTMRHQLA